MFHLPAVRCTESIVLVHCCSTKQSGDDTVQMSPLVVVVVVVVVKIVVDAVVVDATIARHHSAS